VKRELGFEGIKGWEKGKDGGFLVLLSLDCYAEKERLTDFLVGVGKPQHIVSGSSALEAS
jgi:hypothetical protein